MTSALSTIESEALNVLAIASKAASILQPGGAISTAVSGLLSAAGDVVQFINTTQNTIDKFTSAINDPIASSFRSGQPFGNLFSTIDSSQILQGIFSNQTYGGIYITKPVTASLSAINFNQLNASSTLQLSMVPLAQQQAITIQTGVVLNNDADLAEATQIQFQQVTQANQLAFGNNIKDLSSLTAAPAQTTPTPTIPIVVLTPTPNVANLGGFITQLATTYSNIDDVAAVATSIWQENLGSLTDGSGNTIPGVPAGLSSGIYNEIINASNQSQGDVVSTYADTVNQANFNLALLIDYGMTQAFTSFIANNTVVGSNNMVTNRLVSVAARGDSTMLLAMFVVLGVNSIPNAVGLITMLLQNLAPNDQPELAVPPPIVFTTASLTLITQSSSLTTQQIIADLQTMFSLLGITMTTILTQNIGNMTTVPSMLNSTLINTMNQQVLAFFVDPSQLQMATMFN